MAYAEYTKVPVSQTQSEITGMLKKAGATQTLMFEEATRASVGFFLKDRKVLFHLPLRPDDSPQKQRVRWRGLLLCLKAKLESVTAGIETFDDAFLAHIALDTGETVGQAVKPTLLAHYKAGHMPQSLLPPPTKG